MSLGHEFLTCRRRHSINLEPYFLWGQLSVNFIKVLVALSCSQLLGWFYLFALVPLLVGGWLFFALGVCCWVIIDKGCVFLLQPGSYPTFCPSHQPTNQTYNDEEPCARKAFPPKAKVLTWDNLLLAVDKTIWGEILHLKVRKFATKLSVKQFFRVPIKKFDTWLHLFTQPAVEPTNHITIHITLSHPWMQLQFQNLPSSLSWMVNLDRWKRAICRSRKWWAGAIFFERDYWIWGELMLSECEIVTERKIVSR